MPRATEPSNHPLPAADTEALTHPLPGLEPDNLLAILALLGLLRALEFAKPDWRVRARWNCQTAPIRPELSLREPVTRGVLIEATVIGCQHLAAAYDFDSLGKTWEFPKLHGDVLREQMHAAIKLGPSGRPRASVLSSLASDAVRDEDGTVKPNRLCVLRGAGHQHFIARLSQHARMQSRHTKPRDRPRPPATAIARALFQSWERADALPTLHWDAWFNRSWAYRFDNPKEHPERIEAGAYYLATIGFSLLTVSAGTERGHLALRSTLVQEDAAGTAAVWPIWSRPLSLPSIRVLLTHPALYPGPAAHAERERLGIREVRRAMRVWVGDYEHFTRGVTS